MATIVKCDRCGKVFDDIERLWQIEGRQMRFRQYKRKAADTLMERFEFVLEFADLCDDCQKSLQKWWLQGGEKDV